MIPTTTTVRRASTDRPQAPRDTTPSAKPESSTAASISVRPGTALSVHPSGDGATASTTLPTTSRDSKSVWRLPSTKSIFVALLLATSRIKGESVPTSMTEGRPEELPSGTHREPAQDLPDFGEQTFPESEDVWLPVEAELQSDGLNGTLSGSEGAKARPVSASQIALLSGMGALSALHFLPPFISHSLRVTSSTTWKGPMQRHESLLGENLSVRGMVQIYNYANSAVPGALKPNATAEQQAKWAIAATIGFNARMFLESAESAYVFPNRPGSDCFNAVKSTVTQSGVLPRALFPLTNLVGLPLVAKKMDESDAMKEFHRLIGWGSADGKAPLGFNNKDGLLWFESRFHLTTLLSEVFNAYGMVSTGKDYDWDNALSAGLNVWAGPQIGALGVTMTQLIPIIGRINALQHGSAGPESLRALSQYQLGRYLIYALATPVLTWPQYDFVMTLMSNVPNGKGFKESGILSCLEKFGRPCVGGPTRVLYETSGYSNAAFVPLAVSAAAQLALMIYLKKYFSQTGSPTDSVAVELSPVRPRLLDDKGTSDLDGLTSPSSVPLASPSEYQHLASTPRRTRLTLESDRAGESTPPGARRSLLPQFSLPTLSSQSLPGTPEKPMPDRSNPDGGDEADNSSESNVDTTTDLMQEKAPERDLTSSP